MHTYLALRQKQCLLNVGEEGRAVVEHVVGEGKFVPDCGRLGTGLFCPYGTTRFWAAQVGSSGFTAHLSPFNPLCNLQFLFLLHHLASSLPGSLSDSLFLITLTSLLPPLVLGDGGRRAQGSVQ